MINWNNIQNPYLNRPIEVILPNEITDSHLNFRNFEKPEDWKFDFLKDLSDFGMSKIFDKFSKYWIFYIRTTTNIPICIINIIIFILSFVYY